MTGESCNFSLYIGKEAEGEGGTGEVSKGGYGSKLEVALGFIENNIYQIILELLGRGLF